MNDKTLDYLMKRMESRKDARDRSDGRDGYFRSDRESGGRDSRHGNVDFEGSMDFRDRGDSRDYRDSRDYGDSRDSRDSRDRASRDYEDRRDSRDYRDSRGSRDYGDYRGRSDGHSEAPRLTKSDFRRWSSMLENFDGSRGYHYDMSQISEVADKLRLSFKEFSEKEYCATVNMMYSDYGHILKRYAGSAEELLKACAEMAKAFLEDPDGPEPSEKLALYFHCIVDTE